MSNPARLASDEDEAEIAAALGRRISQARMRAGLTLRTLANRVGIDHSTLANYESGRRPLRVTHLVLIARAIGCAPAALLMDSLEAQEIVNQLDGNIERTLQVQYILETLQLPPPAKPEEG
jgi:transcriptional regulator with XRE-family HTH domain